jgi:hypothetical protein
MADKVPRNLATVAGLRGTIETMFPIREAPTCGQKLHNIFMDFDTICQQIFCLPPLDQFLNK